MSSQKVNKKLPATRAAPLPSREDILAFIARERDVAVRAGSAQPAKIGKREIARAFGLDAEGKMALKRLLRELETEGAVARKRSSLTSPGVLPPVVLADITGRTRDGELTAEPVEWDAPTHGKAPRILVTMPSKRKAGAPVPGVGNRVLLRVEPGRDSTPERPHYEGRVIKLIAKTKAQLLGIFRDGPGAGGRIIPIDKKNANRELEVPEGHRGAAQDGDLVAVEILREGRYGLPQARVAERLGSIASERAISLIAIHTHNIPHVFRPDALAEAEHARAASLQGREDWRDLPLITIDPADAKDHDDAVFAMPDDSEANPGGFIVTVAIADVAAYVRPGSGLDREALLRGNSVYFPDRVVPMLPERISNDLCSLLPLQDRPALAVQMVLDKAGKKLRHMFHRIMMRSAAKLSYQQAQAAIDGHTDATTAPILDSVLKPLWAAYAAATTARGARAPLELDLPERKLLLKPDGTIDRVISPPRLDAPA